MEAVPFSSFACVNSFKSSWSSPCCFSRCLIFVSSVPTLLKLSRDVFVVDPVEGARLDREAVVCGRGGAGAVEDDDEPTMLALRTGARRLFCEGVCATDGRRDVTGGLGATTLVGRAATLEGRTGLGVGGAALGLGGAFEGDAAEVDAGLGAIFGAGCEMIRIMLLSRTNSPKPGEQLKYRSPRTDPSFLPSGVGSSIPSQRPSATWMGPMYCMRPC
jgi:hypothetical protein